MRNAGTGKQAEGNLLRVESTIAIYFDRREECYIARDVHFGLGSSASTMSEAVDETIKAVQASLALALRKGELQSYLSCRGFAAAVGQWTQPGGRHEALLRSLTSIAQELASSEHLPPSSVREPEVDAALRLHHYIMPTEQAVAASGA